MDWQSIKTWIVRGIIGFILAGIAALIFPPLQPLIKIDGITIFGSHRTGLEHEWATNRASDEAVAELHDRGDPKLWVAVCLTKAGLIQEKTLKNYREIEFVEPNRFFAGERLLISAGTKVGDERIARCLKGVNKR